MLEDKEPIAMARYEKYNNLAMPNARLNKGEALALIDYVNGETQRLMGHLEHVGAKAPVTAAFTVRQDEPACDVVAVMNAWVRETDPKAKVHAGYMKLVNVGAEDVTLLHVESDAYKSIEVHESAMVDGLTEMREVTDRVIPANGRIHLEPGGKHLMLMGPQGRFSARQKVGMTLTFESGRQQTVSVKVAARQTLPV